MNHVRISEELVQFYTKKSKQLGSLCRYKIIPSMMNELAAPAQLWVRYFNCGGTHKLALIAEWLTQVFFPVQNPGS